MDKFVKECLVNDVLQYQALEIWEDIKVGVDVQLSSDKRFSKQREQEVIENGANQIDENIKALKEEVKVLKKEVQNLKNVQRPEEVKVMLAGKTIGYLSKDDSKLIIDIINCGYDIFCGRISSKEEKNEENRRIKVAIFIEKN